MANHFATFSPIRALSLREQVVEQVRTAIIKGQLKPNDHITELSLTEQMGVSRTPVREALILLEGEGLVVSYPNRGYFVRSFDQRDVQEIFTMRTHLENFAAELVVNRLDETDFTLLEYLIKCQREAMDANDFETVRTADMNFHTHLIKRSDHALLIRGWTELVAQVGALLQIRAEVLEYDEYQAFHDHQRILDAYRSRDLHEIMVCNQAINARVCNECQRALKLAEDMPGVQP